jgi:galactose mutarotase-like enzyme
MPLFQLKNNSLTVSINSFGAELSSVIKNNIEYIWQANPDVWARHAPVLFPIVGKLKEGNYSYQNNYYSLSQHGFARDIEFICIEQTESKLVFELTASENLLKLFPFHFSLQITYSIDNDVLKTEYSVFNPDNTNLHFSIGAHPAFNCCLNLEDTFEDMELIFPSKNELIINTLNDGLIKPQTKQVQLTNNRLAITKELFDNDALVMMNNQIDDVYLLSKKSQLGVKMTCKHWPYFGIWTKKHTNQFICLEPWYGIADIESSNGDFEKKEGIITVLPKNYFKCEFDITFV